jgi:hypothetical protein
MHLRPRTRIREDKAVTEQSTQVDEGNPLPEPPQLPPEPEPEPETFPPVLRRGAPLGGR